MQEKNGKRRRAISETVGWAHKEYVKSLVELRYMYQVLSCNSKRKVTQQIRKNGNLEGKNWERDSKIQVAGVKISYPWPVK